MADLNPADPRRLANEFFAVRAGEAETAALGLELEADDGAALGFLGLARSAREGAPAPAGLDAEAEAAVDQGLEALIASHARKPGLFHRLARRFRRGVRGSQPPAAKAAPASEPSVPVLLPALRPPALVRSVPGRTEADMEDTAPIAEVPEPGSASPERPAVQGPPPLPSRRLPPPPLSVPAESLLAAPREGAVVGPLERAVAARQERAVAGLREGAVAALRERAVAALRPSAVKKASGFSSRRAGLLAGLLLASLLALGLYTRGPALMTRAVWGPWIASSRAALASRIPRTWAPWLAPPRAVPVPPSRPLFEAQRAAPTPALPLREDAAASVQTVPLPVELPQATPAQAGVWN